MNTSKKLATLQTRIWFLYDKKKFKELSKTATKLFIALDFSKKKSILSGKHVSNAHFFYDKAVEEDEKGNNEKRNYYFRKALEEQIKIRKILSEDIRAAYYENEWWKKFHYGNYVGLLPYMFCQQMVMYKGYNFLIPLRTTYYLIKAGLEGHNKRKINVAIKYLEKYWEITLKHMKDKIQY